jgi:hypothetical protein
LEQSSILRAGQTGALTKEEEENEQSSICMTITYVLDHKKKHAILRDQRV